MAKDNHDDGRWKVYVLLIFATLFWGGQFNAAKIAVHYLPPLTTAAARFIVAASVIFIFILFTQRNIVAVVRRNWLIYLGLGLVGVVGFNVFFFFGMCQTSPTNAALIVATNPLVTALIASIVNREVIGREHKIGTLLSFGGVAALTLTGSSNSLLRVNFGDVFIFGAVICFALYAVLGRKYLRDSSPVMTTAATMIVGAPVLLIIARLKDGVVPLTGLPIDVYLAIAWMSLLGSVLGYIFWNQGLIRVGVHNTAVFFHLVPVFTVILSLILGQTVNLKQITAGVVVITGVLISTGTFAIMRSRLSAKVSEEQASN